MADWIALDRLLIAAQPGRDIGICDVWMLYNGMLAYVMMGLLFGGEWLVRRRVKAAHAHG
ncbi:hypothetical protein [Stenotrophomonas indicatrix]|uniref:hypothetical protein n=1 Tax=Stenotrophomonas indicatrix TaxID=2045451 RepID=UPI001CBFF320|nr:hypothetical protein [Stenotrophomonas indicatrix]